MTQDEAPDDSFMLQVESLIARAFPQNTLGKGLTAFVTDTGNQILSMRFAKRIPDAFERGIALLLDLAVGDCVSPFKLERFRGRVPDRILAALYNARRNACQSHDELRVRILAGVVDEEGRPLQGYLLRENGCINDDAGRATNGG